MTNTNEVTAQPNAQAQVDVRQAEIDARTLYDLACISANDPKAGREQVQGREIALRNFKFIAAVAELIEANVELTPAQEAHEGNVRGS